ncbi:hypothetical protein GALMADRAFT_239979 [Galerina marginata CBS 339.88]|uniref:Uncharacterized protein n=1 Tax=Galerina marginata (strain CBS 339.88) TaxID=685588 RepID=A0A067TF39_GALM3|nr:hypothetical protein GALMADRAFT_239979 [Galerina marginata CBS 339.88]
MASSPLLESFDPFATHPFTNGSGVTPQPPPPSVYAVPIPSTNTYRRYYMEALSQYPQLSTSASSITSTRSTESSPPRLHSPRPQRRSPALTSSKTTPASPQQIFVPCRKHTSSPDLVLKKRLPTSNIDATQRPR